MCAEYFPGMTSRISGIGVSGIQNKAKEIHALGWKSGTDVLPIGGFYKTRRAGEDPCLAGPDNAYDAVGL